MGLATASVNVRVRSEVKYPSCGGCCAAGMPKLPPNQLALSELGRWGHPQEGIGGVSLALSME